jgi:hypothetical protein
MIRLHLLLLAMLAMAANGCGGADTTALRDTDVDRLSATRASLKQAMLDGDIETIDRIYSKDYELVTRKGNLLSRSQRIAMLESRKLRYLDIGDERDVTIKIYGHVAVVRGVVGAAETEFDGERRRSEPRRFTEIWVHMNGEWREVRRHTTAIAASAP